MSYQKKLNNTGREIAVIGMAGVFPESQNIKMFWENICNRKELTSLLSVEEFVNRGFSKEKYNQKDYVPLTTQIPGKDYFDSNFFGYLPMEANVMDPQTRLFHQVIWNALEDAGINLNKHEKDIGLFAGASNNLLWEAHTRFSKDLKGNGLFSSRILSDKNKLAGIVSYNLGLKGPAIAVDTACSTSLVAVHMAARSLLMGECNTAIAGGVRLLSSTEPGYFYEEGLIYSSDGHCKPFDKDSSGTVSGQGAGAVILKRLKDAVEQQDHIYAIIKGSAMNNDGSRKISITAPSIDGQVDCIKLAHKISKVDPETITYVEAHGTATKLGDAIEVEALNIAFNNNLNKHCYIGAVKSNVGHLDAAAGITGFIKTVLALHHKKIPPTINYTTNNPAIPFDQGPFKVADTLLNWKKEEDVPLRAGVSAFGIGGTNAHVILEEAPVIEFESTKKEYKIFPFSAKSEVALEQTLQRMETYALEQTKTPLANLAYTLQTGRQSFSYRTTILAATKQEFIQKIREQKKHLFTKTQDVQLAFMFPGQGSQYYKMGLTLYQEEAFFKEMLDQGFDLLKKESQEDLKEILFGDVDPEIINQTYYSQALIFIFEYALARYLMQLGAQPSMMIGHSIGEYTAACLGGVFSFEDTIKILLKRGALMSQLSRGQMIAVSASKTELAQWMDEGVSIAASNAPKQCICSGHTTNIEAFTKKLDEVGVPYKLLKTSKAFHSYMMDEILEDFQDFVSQFECWETSMPYVSTVTGEVITSKELLSPAYWANQIRATVAFAKGINTLLESGAYVFVEVGPGDTLTKLTRQNDQNGQAVAVVNMTGREKGVEKDSFYFANGIGKLWQHGVAINWELYHQGYRQKVSIPGYCFEPTYYRTEVNIPFGQTTLLETNMAVTEEKIDVTLSSDQNEMLAVLAPPATTFKNEIDQVSHQVIKGSEEQSILLFLKDFFGDDSLDPQANFFELGGDSLRAVSLINSIYKAFNVKIPIQFFMEEPTIELLIKEIEERSWVNNKNNYANTLEI